jgi:hypothetical protein
MLPSDTGRCVRIDNPDHAVIYTRTYSRTVEEYGVGVFDLDAVGWWGGKDRVDGLKPAEETSFALPNHFVGDTWEAVFGAHDAMV